MVKTRKSLLPRPHVVKEETDQTMQTVGKTIEKYFEHNKSKLLKRSLDASMKDQQVMINDEDIKELCHSPSTDARLEPKPKTMISEDPLPFRAS